MLCKIFAVAKNIAPVAQLDRASGYGPEGCKFDSCRARFFVMNRDLLYTKDLEVHFSQNKKIIKALERVNINLQEGMATALVGESGSGKTTLAKTILQFIKPNNGRIYFRGQEITGNKNTPLVRKNIQIIFQNPYLSLDPRYTVFSALYEALTVFNKIEKAKAKKDIVDILNWVELDESILNRYPHQLSGGQRQRICLARSLINKPALLILDEPTSNLDITTAVKILDLLKKLQKEFNLTFLFISHDLKLLRKIAQVFYVIYEGKVLEYGPADKIFDHPRHPYTKLLKQAAYQNLSDYPDKEQISASCPFYGCCNIRTKQCLSECNSYQVEPGHFVFCNGCGL